MSELSPLGPAGLVLIALLVIVVIWSVKDALAFFVLSIALAVEKDAPTSDKVIATLLIASCGVCVAAPLPLLSLADELFPFRPLLVASALWFLLSVAFLVIFCESLLARDHWRKPSAGELSVPVGVFTLLTLLVYTERFKSTPPYPSYLMIAHTSALVLGTSIMLCFLRQGKARLSKRV